MRAIRILVSCCVAACAVFAQDPAEKRGSISGRAIDALTGAPVPGAKIRTLAVKARLAGGGSIVAGTRASAVESDAEGRFSISPLGAGEYHVLAECRGYEKGRHARTPLALSAGQDLSQIEIRLTPQASVSGRIVDEFGEPAAGVSVQVLEAVWRRGQRRLASLGSARTDDTGRYRVEYVQPGRHYALAAPPSEFGFSRLYYPGVADIGQAVRIQAQPGTEAQSIDFKVRRQTGYRVVGSVSDPSGMPAAAGYVCLYPKEALSPDGFATALVQRGSFEFRNIVPGAYTLRAVLTREGLVAETPLSLGAGDAEGIAIRVAGPRPLAGKITLPPGEKVEPRPLRVWLTVEDLPLPHSREIPVDETLSFTAPAVYAARYRAAVYGLPAGAYVASGDFDASAGPPDRLEVAVRLDGASVSGVVRQNDKPFEDAVVVLAPQEAGRTARSTYSLDGGAFSFVSVPPGSYRLFAWEEARSNVWEDPEFLRRYASEGAALDVAPRSQHNVSLKLIPAER